MLRTSVFALVLGLIVASSAGQTTQNAPDIAPFIDSNTIIVARLDPGAIDLDATQAEEEKLITDAVAGGDTTAWLDRYRQAMSKARRWLGEFKSAGGTTIYGLIHISFEKDEFASGFNPFQVVLPLQPGGDAGALESLLIKGAATGGEQTGANPSLSAIVAHNAVFYGRAGAIERLATRPSVPRPALAEALAAGSNAPCIIAVAPTYPLKLIALQLLPDRLPSSDSGILTAKLVYGLDWISIGVKFGSAPSLTTRIHCHDAASTALFADYLDALSEWFRQRPQSPDVMIDPEIMAKVLHPDITGNTLVLHVDNNDSGLLTRISLKDLLPGR
jgi:hypothetical protein